MVYDYIIVGGGSAGCVAANRLVSDYGARVLLLEAGAKDDSPLIKMPAGTFKLMFGGSSYVKRHVSKPQPSLGGRQVAIAQANVLGGGSSINMMAYTRGSRQDYENWNNICGSAGWGWDDLVPFFKRQEGNLRLDNAAHSGDGPLKVSDAGYICDAAHIFVRTMQRLGVAFTADFTGGDLRGVGYVQTTTFRAERCSAASAFLHPILNDPLLTVVTKAKARRILFDGLRAVGVEYESEGKILQVEVRNEVILAAGTFVTPKLLMLSGIGPASHLTEHGIPVRVDSPGVGQNLQDHNMVALSASTNGRYGYFGEDKGLRMLRNGLQYHFFKTGPVASNGGETMAFVNLEDLSGEPDIQLYGLGVVWPDEAGFVPPGNGISLVASLLQPRSRGNVQLKSADPADDPVINPNWMSDPADREKLLRALKYLRTIATQTPLADVMTKELAPGSAVQSDEALLAYILKTTDTNYHPVGTCRMGRADDPQAVLTPDLKVKGVEGVRIVDASMMPSIISANTNATVMAVADKGVAMMMGHAAVGGIGASLQKRKTDLS